jgi:hypothetical protein
MLEAIIYGFEIIGPRLDTLGDVALPDDAAAIEFAKGTIQDVTREGDSYAGCILRVSDGERTIALLPVVALN